MNGRNSRYVRAKDQAQNGFEKLNQGKRVQEQTLLKGDGSAAGVHSVAQYLPDKQGQRQQEQIDDKCADNHCGKL